MKLNSTNWEFIINTEELLVLKTFVGKVDEEIAKKLGMSPKEFNLLSDIYYNILDSVKEISRDIE